MNESPGKRITTKDLNARIADVERRLAELSEQVQKINERVDKIANSLAQQPLRV
ncbi:MAG: hypothetical protein ACREQF_01215 [Candidatus Binataceae bacterium]